MIDIVEGNGRNLRNIRQIGTPAEEDKIYVENNAYERLHLEEFAEKRVFVLMGHTECVDKHYATFIEAVIPIRDIDFSGNLPLWNNHAWGEVFREVKRVYEDAIIVGWALDIKGMSPKMTPELEAVHREQFGGAHQLFLFMDSLEQEEYFYLSKKNHLRRKDGFYIYYDAKSTQPSEPMEVQLEIPKTSLIPAAVPAAKEKEAVKSRARYREAVYNRKKEASGKKITSYAAVAAAALLIGVIGAGIYQKRITLSDLEKVIAAMGQKSKVVNTEGETEDFLQEMEDTESGSDTQAQETKSDAIPVEDVPAGDLLTPAQENEAQPQAETSMAVPQYYTVRKGDTLTAICRRIYGTSGRLGQLRQMNGLTETDVIWEGQQLVLPQ